MACHWQWAPTAPGSRHIPLDSSDLGKKVDRARLAKGLHRPWREQSDKRKDRPAGVRKGMVGGRVDKLVVSLSGAALWRFPFVKERSWMSPALNGGRQRIEEELSALEQQAWGPAASCAGRHISDRCSGRTVCRRQGASSSAVGTRCRGDQGVLSVMRQRSCSWPVLSSRAGNLVNRVRVDHGVSAKRILAARRVCTKKRDIVQTTTTQFTCQNLS